MGAEGCLYRSSWAQGVQECILCEVELDQDEIWRERDEEEGRCRSVTGSLLAGRWESEFGAGPMWEDVEGVKEMPGPQMLGTDAVYSLPCQHF